jgi:hypothetical protein
MKIASLVGADEDRLCFYNSLVLNRISPLFVFSVISIQCRTYTYFPSCFCVNPPLPPAHSYSNRATDWTTGVGFPAGAGRRFFLSSPPLPGQLRGPPRLLLSDRFRGQSGRSVKLTTNLPLAKVMNAYTHTSILPYIFMAWCLVNDSIRLHGVVLS